MKRVLIVLLVLGLLALVGCGGAGQATGTSPTTSTANAPSSSSSALPASTTTSAGIADLERQFLTDFSATSLEFVDLLQNQPAPAECASRLKTMTGKWQDVEAPSARTQDLLTRWLMYAGLWQQAFDKASTGDFTGAKAILDANLSDTTVAQKLGEDLGALMAKLGMSMPTFSTSSTSMAATTTSEATTTTEIAAETWEDGTYLVGTDIPAGLYKGDLTGGMGYWGIYADANGDDIVANDTVIGPFYVQVKNGQYLKLSGVEIQPKASVPKGTPATSDIGPGVYLVGTDIAAGKYKGAVDEDMGYWGITSDANGEKIISNDLPKGQFYVTVKAGQYLKLSGVTIARVK